MTSPAPIGDIYTAMSGAEGERVCAIASGETHGHLR